MRGAAVWWRVGCALAALLGAYLLISGLVRITGDGAVGGPLARLLVGLVLLSAAAVAYAIGRRRPDRPAGQPTSARADDAAETVTCPACGSVNPPSRQHCLRCDQALR
ncbi:zinc finger Ran-binding domain-containing protein [Nocardioidaceae bacterium]|nr:zinc finger Ran-binding domain-containing protein [Nocardioidaceae bacterium]